MLLVSATVCWEVMFFGKSCIDRITASAPPTAGDYDPDDFPSPYLLAIQQLLNIAVRRIHVEAGGRHVGEVAQEGGHHHSGCHFGDFSWDLQTSEKDRDIVLPLPDPVDTANPSAQPPLYGFQTGGVLGAPTIRGISNRSPATDVPEGVATQTEDAKVRNDGGEASKAEKVPFPSGSTDARDWADSIGKAMREKELEEGWENAQDEEQEQLRKQAEEEEQREKAGDDEVQDVVVIDDDEDQTIVLRDRILSLPDRGVFVLGAYALPGGAFIIVARGSITEYSGDAAVNSATPEGDGGQAPEGSVDKAFQDKGGLGMARARRELPILPGNLVRIPEGKARPTHLGLCLTSIVVHAIVPSYTEKPGQTREECYKGADECLEETYTAALKVAHEKGARSIGTCLISAGKSIGEKSVTDVVRLAVDIIVAEAQPGTEITLVAHAIQEIKALIEACESIQEHVISHIMDYSARLEEDKRFVEAKAGANDIYAKNKEEREEVKLYDPDRCGPGFLQRRYKWMWNS